MSLLNQCVPEIKEFSTLPLHLSPRLAEYSICEVADPALLCKTCCTVMRLQVICLVLTLVQLPPTLVCLLAATYTKKYLFQKRVNSMLYLLKYLMAHGGGVVTVDAEAATNRVPPVLKFRARIIMSSEKIRKNSILDRKLKNC